MNKYANQIFVIFGLCYLVSAIAAGNQDPKFPLTSQQAAFRRPELPPLIFPTDAKRNNIVPINKTAIKILLHEDVHKKDSVELDDMKKTDDDFADSETKYALLHPALIAQKGDEQEANKQMLKDQVEEYQKNDNQKMVIELEERFHKPESDFMKMSITEVGINHGLDNSNLAWASLCIVVLFAVIIYLTLVVWRSKLETRYGRHRLVNENGFQEMAI